MMAEGVAIENMDASNEKSMDGVQEVGESSSQLSASLLIVIGELANQKFLPALSDRLSKGNKMSDAFRVTCAHFRSRHSTYTLAATLFILCFDLAGILTFIVF